jgi:hypothetical protein
MIASVKRPKSNTKPPAWHVTFLALLPAIRRHAQISFRKMRSDLRLEMIDEVVARCCAAYARLVDLGKEEVAYPSALARFAVAQVRAGRRVGNRLRIRDAMSEYAQRNKGFIVEPLDHFDKAEGCWREILIEDRRSTPAEIAACRLDFSAWLKLLPSRRRKIALELASGAATSFVAKKFEISPGRISQERLLLKKSWERFQGEDTPEDQSRLAVAW